jgi:hypothetical protein
MKRRRSLHARPVSFEDSNAPGCVRSHGFDDGAANWCRHGQRSRPDRKPLNMVASERVLTTTVGDLLANRWQATIRVAHHKGQAGCWTRPVLLVWGGAPRRNRTGDPILTMEPPGTAVRTTVSPGHAQPSRPKLSVLIRRSYAFGSHYLERLIIVCFERPE